MDNILGNPHTRLSQTEIDRLYSILERFDTLAFKVGLPYTMACGTALGAVLRGGIIPWDNDADLFARTDDFYTALPELQKQAAGFLRIERYTKWSDGRGWYKIYSLSNPEPNVDLYLLSYDASTHVWRPSDPQIAKRSNLFLDALQNAPATRVPFGPLRLPLFPSAPRFFDRYYGTGWQHKSSELEVLSGKWSPSTLKDFRPALPTTRL